MQKDNDNELLYLIYANNERAYLYLFKKYERSISYLIRKYQRKRDSCFKAEQMQIARIKLLHAVYAYREEKNVSFSHYFLEIYENTLIDEYRMNFAKKLMYECNEISVEGYVMDVDARYLIEKQQESYCFELRDRVERVKKRMKPVETQIVDLRVSGHSYEEISRDLKVTKKKIDNTLQKVKKINN